jgi:SAM-dependent methyltransferase
MNNEVNAFWYREFFSGPMMEFWQRIVPAELTAAQVKWIARHALLPERGRVLDLPCGTGRHAIELARRGYRVTGVDVSAASIEIASRLAREAGVMIDLHVEDMSHYEARERFDAVLCLGNSFGYLAHGATLRYLQLASAALVPGGRLLMDVGAVAESVLPHYEQTFSIDAGDMRLEIANEYDVVRGGLWTQFTFTEGDSVTVQQGWQSVYTCAEIGRMLEAAGLGIVARHGTPDDKPYELGDRGLHLVAERV